jgi:hypothetical protein
MSLFHKVKEAIEKGIIVKDDIKKEISNGKSVINEVKESILIKGKKTKNNI